MSRSEDGRWQCHLINQTIHHLYTIERHNAASIAYALIMPLLLRFSIVSIVVLLLLVASLLLLALDKEPAIPLAWRPNAQLAKEVFKKTAARAQRNQSLDFDEQELNHALNSIVNRYLHSVTQVKFGGDNSALVTTSLRLPGRLACCYVNMRVHLMGTEGGLKIERFSVGHLVIQDWVASGLLNFALKHSALKQYYFLAEQHIKSLHIRQRQLQIDYVFNTLAKQYTESPCRVDCQDPAASPPNLTTTPEALNYYQQQLELVVRQHNPQNRLSLADLLVPLFRAAQQHSSLANAINENIAIIYVVCAYVNHNEIPFYIPTVESITPITIYQVFLYKRTDQAKHFMLSAALTTVGSAHLADILGQEKELRDAQSSSGFSFVDLAADRAGMKFSERATKSPQSAKELQQIMASVTDYQAFMPMAQDLPENLSNAEFTQRFDSINSKNYRQLLQSIDDRIEALPIYPKKSS